MSVILIEQDPFVEDIAGLERTTPSTEYYNVRRPLYGALNKTDQFASIAVKGIDDNGVLRNVVIPNSSALGGGGTENYNFIVNNFTFQQQEKVQIIETFGDEYTFFFGKRPTVVQVQGFLINTPDFNWRNEWYHNYEHFLRGTKCVERKSRVYLTIDGLVFVGYILSCQTQLTDQTPRLTPFSFGMLVTNFRDTNVAVVNKGEEARNLPDSIIEWYGVEYLGNGRNEVTNGVEWDEVEQKYKPYSGSMSGPGSVESDKTAYWLSDPEFTGLKHTYSDVEAMKEIGVQRYQDKNSVSRFEAIAAFNSGNTLFSTTNNSNDDIKKALGKGLQGGAARIS